MGDYLDQLSSFVCETKFKDLDEPAVAATRDVLMDTFGAILAGSRLPENAKLAQFAVRHSGRATATIIGDSNKCDPMFAAMVNATAGVSLEQDEGNRWGGGHPSIHVVPGGVGVGEELGIDGKKLIESVVVGYEVESRMGSGTKVRNNVHLHGVWGVISTAVTVAKLLNYKERQVKELINIAACMSPAPPFNTCYEGATIRNSFPGSSAFQGIMAVDLQIMGYTGLKDGPASVYGVILGESFDPDKVVEGLGNGLRIQQNYFKFHAACRSVHPPLDATMSLVQKEEFGPQDVDWIKVASLPFSTPKTDEAYPENMLSSKFHIPYAVAATIVRRTANVTSFYEDAVHDPKIRELADKVELTYDPQMNSRRSDYPTAKVSIGLKDGRTLNEITKVVRGDAANPVPREELVSKFMFLSTPAVGAERAEEVVKTVARVDELKDIRELTALLATTN